MMTGAQAEVFLAVNVILGEKKFRYETRDIIRKQVFCIYLSEPTAQQLHQHIVRLQANGTTERLI
jgi:hypothetical protein